MLAGGSRVRGGGLPGTVLLGSRFWQLLRALMFARRLITAPLPRL